MCEIIIVVAYDEDRAISKDGNIPWSLPEDMAHFKEITDGECVVMGRKTWDSLPVKFKPLPGRTNIVISRTKHESVFYHPKEPYWVTSLEAAIRLVGNVDDGKNIMIIGGGEIYREALDKGFVNRVIASEVLGHHDGDMFFPELIGWVKTIKREHNGFVVMEYVKA